MMSSITALPSSARTTQSIVAIVTLIATAAASIYIIHKTHQKKRPSSNNDDDNDDNDGNDNDDDDDYTRHQNDKHNSFEPNSIEPTDFYEKLGISEANLPMHVQREIYKERRRQEKVESISRKTPMYDNILMHDVDGNPMCCVSMKKAKWYVKKGIAEWSLLEDMEGRDVVVSSNEGDNNNNNNGEVNDATGDAAGDVGDAAGDNSTNATCIRLLFEHNRAEPESYEETSDTNFARYLRTAKRNVCVRCGDDGHHMRHYILPYTYRTLLPEEYKKHMSHDVVILCPDCHVTCERASKGRMKALEDQIRMVSHGADSMGVPPMIDDPHLGHVKSCAIALVKWRDNIPAEKLERYEREVREYLASVCDNEEEKESILNGTATDEEGRPQPLTKAQLQTACSVRYRVKNPEFVPGPVIVVDSLKGEEDNIDAFIIDWRKHFIDTANPQHMPTGWTVDNPVICRLGKDGPRYKYEP
eukprot:CAMPEP_0201603782 /NCGR_PEP_ID=MMETSP0492-20130828/4124_1 /ASSEMBLY_ACC=CAM_ASM_000837 /TAXON_ID=420259 /ORGANISM="Thalassiosira gravida, Strain GMp14c1" /LENGTH=471 /DNA_ID=CAMNT_0048067645 /DNA_START=52 /DNA_END=1467 /DNA_ORIENTATION=+